MTQQEAKELCILKWEYIVNNNGSDYGLIPKYPQLADLKNECGYCELFMITEVPNFCIGCPINFGKGREFVACRRYNHPYRKWTNKPTKRRAQKVLDLIKNS